MTQADALAETHRQLPSYPWHGIPQSKWSDSNPDRLTRCHFCLRFFELLERDQVTAEDL